MTVQNIYVSYTEKTSKDFFRMAEGARAKAVAELNDRFYEKVSERSKQEEIEV